MKCRLLSATSLVCGGAAAFLTLWILFPAPLYLFWLAGVLGTEWSLWWGVLGLIGIGFGFWSRRSGGRRAAAAGIACGIFAGAVSLIPLLQSIRIARQSKITLSAGRFFFGSGRVKETVEAKTVSFATVNGHPLLLDVYPAHPSNSEAPGPAIIVVHGGSWSGGNKSDFPHWDRWLSDQGYTVFDIQYRLAPQPSPSWHAALSDVKTAIAWVKSNATSFQVNPDRVALLGRSAGGHLALLAAYTGGVNTRAAAVISLYGPTDLTWGYYHPAKPDVIDGPGTLRRFLGGDPASRPDIYKAASPITHVGRGTPPTLLFHGERDLLVGPQHTRRLSKQLSLSHVPFESVYIPYALHGFDFNINGWGAQIEQPILLAFLRKHLSFHSHK